MATLYELTGDYLTLLDMMDDPDVDPEVLADTMEGIEGELKIKADNYAKVLKNLDSEVDSIKNEITRLQARKKAIENNSARLKRSLQDSMVAVGETKFRTDLFSFNIQKNPAKVVMDETDIMNIPLEYLTVQLPTVNKKAIQEALKDGVDLTGIAHFEQDSSLRIR